MKVHCDIGWQDGGLLEESCWNLLCNFYNILKFIRPFLQENLLSSVIKCCRVLYNSLHQENSKLTVITTSNATVARELRMTDSYGGQKP